MNGSYYLLVKLHDVTVWNDTAASGVYKSSVSLRPSDLLRRLAQE